MKQLHRKTILVLLVVSKIIIGMDTAKNTTNTTSLIQTTTEPSSFTKIALEAIDKDSVSFFKLAESMGSDIHHIDEAGNNPLLIATKNNKPEVTLYLSTHPSFQHNTIINQQNCLGETALMHACFNGYKNVVKKLLTIKNINLDIQDKDGNSALHYAVAGKDKTIIDSLIEQGANPTLHNNKGVTISFYKCILNNSHTLFPTTIEKIMRAQDIQGNNQLHLLTKALIGKMAKLSNKSINELFSEILHGLEKHAISIWSKNNQGMLPLETAYEKYELLYQQYKAHKISCLQNLLRDQEEMLHILLLYYAKKIQAKTPIIISSPYAQQLNIETVIATKYKDKPHYKKYAIAYKDMLKNELLNGLTTIPAIWLSAQPIYSYIPPQLLDDNSICY